MVVLFSTILLLAHNTQHTPHIRIIKTNLPTPHTHTHALAQKDTIRCEIIVIVTTLSMFTEKMAVFYSQIQISNIL